MPVKHSSAILPLSYMLLIFALSSVPGTSDFSNTEFMVTILNPTVQNLVHIPLFGALAFFWISTFKKWRYEESACLLMAAVISVLYGILDEIHQYFIPGRYLSLTDMLLNIIGVSAAVGIDKIGRLTK